MEALLNRLNFIERVVVRRLFDAFLGMLREGVTVNIMGYPIHLRLA